MRLTEFASGGGCGCKLPPSLLRELLQTTMAGEAPADLLVGSRTADDAAVWRLSDTQAIVATTDFFSPIVDAPHDFGAIAAANALSDIYAMGATPLFALALAAMPAATLPRETIAAILEGGRQQCARAGVVVAGGHSIDAKEPLYGLAVVGRAAPDRILTNAAARADDVLLLGKPLGIGVLSAALQRGRLAGEDYRAMLALTTQLNSAGSELAAVDGVHAMTDVTGFGLLGHLAEMCRAAALGAVVQFDALPLIDAAVAHAKDGIATGAAARNWQSVADMLEGADALADWQQNLLADPQTSGGLLVACQRASAAAVQEVFQRHGQQAARIGNMTAAAGIIVQAAC